MAICKKDLACKIMSFVSKYAAISPNYDSEFDDPEDKFTGPDPSMLIAAAKILENGQVPNFKVHSDWGSGCYQPYLDQEGRKQHDSLLLELVTLSK